MKVLRSNRLVCVLAIVSILAIAAAVGGVGQAGAEPVSAAEPGAIRAAASSVRPFMQIEGISGESTARGHEGQIEVLSWSWGVAQTTTAAGAGGGGRIAVAGRATVVKQIDKATPKLFERCAHGAVFPLVIVHLTREGGQTYLTYELTNVMVSSISHEDVDGDGVPVETLELALGGARLIHTQFDAAGRAIGEVSAEW